MNNKIRTMILAAAVTAIASPALADTAVCTVKAPAIRIRKSPSKKAHIVAILKKDARVTTTEACAGGWVKITSEDGRLSGYVGGWALAAAEPKVVEATITSAKSEAKKTETAPPVATPSEVPTNEKLAIQITELRMNVYNIQQDMQKMKNDIQKIKARSGRKAAGKKGSRHAQKAQGHPEKRG